MTTYYQDDYCTIYHGNCLNVLPKIIGVDLVLTDPPFEKEAHTLNRRVRRGKGLMIENLPFSQISQETREAVAHLLSEKCKKWVLTFCQIEAAPIWRSFYEKFGLVYKRTCLWVKPDGMPQYSGDRPGMGYETFVAMHGAGRSEWNGGGDMVFGLLIKVMGKGLILIRLLSLLRL